MRTFKLIVLGFLLIFAGSTQGQLSVNVHVGSPPAWGPAGYNSVRYYYLPDIEAYYDVRNKMFIYFSGNTWIHRSYLPARYKNYDLYRGYKVVLKDYHGDSPYTHFKENKFNYAKGYKGSVQRNVGVRDGRNNSQSKNHAFAQPAQRDNRNINRIQVRSNESKQVNKNGQSRGKDNNQKGNKDNGNGKGK